jgi:hypothetical protein
MGLGCTQNAEAVYKIKVQGHLDPSWSDWFDGMTIISKNDETLLVGVIPDQSALLGLLMKIGHLNLNLLSVQRLGWHSGWIKLEES